MEICWSRLRRKRQNGIEETGVFFSVRGLMYCIDFCFIFVSIYDYNFEIEIKHIFLIKYL